MTAVEYAKHYTKEQLRQKIERLEAVAYTADTMEAALAVCYALQEMNEALRK
jgi:ADP-ribosylglycohydrolase